MGNAPAEPSPFQQDQAPIEQLIAKGALFVANHSGGKDSQAMLIELLRRVPAEQVIVVHASLGRIEWPGAMNHAKDQAASAGIPFLIARATKTFFELVKHRFETRPEVPSWPSSAQRQCTSDLKRGPIEREIRRYMKINRHTIVVNCLGLRAQESPHRAKATVFRRNERNSIAGRDWYDWLPIHDWTSDKVFETIKAAGQTPHYAYSLGNQRLSCIFCIFGSTNDIKNGAKHHPDLAAEYIALEKETGYTMHQSRKSLQDIIGAA